MRYHICVAIVSVFALTSSVEAQTAEETVAFMTEGLEDGGEIKAGDTKYSIEQEDGKPIFTVAPMMTSSGLTTVTTVARQSECDFKITTTGDPNLDGEYEIDFSRLIGAKRDIVGVLLTFSGSCPVRFRGECQKDYFVAGGADIEPRRLANAIDYFKRTFCTGRSF